MKCMAYSGIASKLLINGATAHSTFQIPIPLLPSSVYDIKCKCARAQILREAAIIIWDDASMIPANKLKAVNILLRNIPQINKPFGGKFMHPGGDFRQVLLVVPRPGTEKQCTTMHHQLTLVAPFQSISTGHTHESCAR